MSLQNVASSPSSPFLSIGLKINIYGYTYILGSIPSSDRHLSYTYVYFSLCCIVVIRVWYFTNFWFAFNLHLISYLTCSLFLAFHYIFIYLFFFYEGLYLFYFPLNIMVNLLGNLFFFLFIFWLKQRLYFFFFLVFYF